MVPVFCLHCHTHKAQAISLSIGYQCTLGFRGEAGFSTLAALISIFRIHIHFMLLNQLDGFFFFICLFDHIYWLLNEGLEFIICISQPGNQRHIIGCCVMIIIVKTIWIDKMRIFTSDVRRRPIHQISKG